MYWMTKFWLLRHDAYAHSVFALPLIPTPQQAEQLVLPFDLGQDPQPQLVQAELDTRLSSLLSLPPSTLSCALTAEAAAEYAPLRDQGPYLFALNLFNNQQVLPTLVRTLLDLADFLGPANTHISIFENGSIDNTTLAMAHFAAALTARGVGHSILFDPTPTNWKKVDRIAQVSLICTRLAGLRKCQPLTCPVLQLSVYRNLALAPVNSTAPNGLPFEDVVFVNDVYLCPRDALELLHQRKLQQADAACALDWRATSSWFARLGFNSVKMYDNWVSLATITASCSYTGSGVCACMRHGNPAHLARPRWRFQPLSTLRLQRPRGAER